MTSENLSQSTVPSLTAAIAAAKVRADCVILLKNLHFLFCWLWENELSKRVHVHAGLDKQRREFRDPVSYGYRHCCRRNVTGVNSFYFVIC